MALYLTLQLLKYYLNTSKGAKETMLPFEGSIFVSYWKVI